MSVYQTVPHWQFTSIVKLIKSKNNVKVVKDRDSQTESEVDMILKFVLYPTKDGDQKTQEIFIECGGFNQSYCDRPERAGQTNYENFAHFAISGTRGKDVMTSMMVDCPNTAVYVMNDSGKTIDSYRWTKTEDGEIKRM